jgi:hypothetical protein
MTELYSPSPRHGRAHPGHPDPMRRRASNHPDHRPQAGDDAVSLGTMFSFCSWHCVAPELYHCPSPPAEGRAREASQEVGRRAGLPAGPAAGGAGGPWQPCAGPSPPKNPACEAPSGSPPSPETSSRAATRATLDHPQARSASCGPQGAGSVTDHCSSAVIPGLRSRIRDRTTRMVLSSRRRPGSIPTTGLQPAPPALMDARLRGNNSVELTALCSDDDPGLCCAVPG